MDSGQNSSPERIYFGGCSSPFNQPVALSDFSGSGRSQSKHWNVRCPLPPGGNARIKNSPQWGQVGRLACPITIGFRLSEKPVNPRRGPIPRIHKTTRQFYLALH
jgi:hypothetical protein